MEVFANLAYIVYFYQKKRMSSYFTKKCSDFLKDLTKNNNREWFNEHKEQFKEFVEKPFHAFIEELINQLREMDPKIQITSKEAVFRIYKDIRFSKDKTPYKEYMAALISKHGRKDHSTPGMYLELRQDGIQIYRGVYEPTKEQLTNIRYFIADHLNEFNKLLQQKPFIKRYGSIQGEKNKLIPADLKEAASKQALIYNKHFYCSCKLEKAWITSDKLIKELINCYKDAKAVNQFFEQAIQA